jgi:hypothetical protein
MLHCVLHPVSETQGQGPEEIAQPGGLSSGQLISQGRSQMKMIRADC